MRAECPFQILLLSSSFVIPFLFPVNPSFGDYNHDKGKKRNRKGWDTETRPLFHISHLYLSHTISYLIPGDGELR